MSKVEAIDVALLLILLDTAVVLNFSKMSFELPSPPSIFSMFARYPFLLSYGLLSIFLGFGFLRLRFLHLGAGGPEIDELESSASEALFFGGGRVLSGSESDFLVVLVLSLIHI